jgi:hypothetical protein
MGSPHTEMGRESQIFPYGESPFPNRVCIDLGINIYSYNVEDCGNWYKSTVGFTMVA